MATYTTNTAQQAKSTLVADLKQRLVATSSSTEARILAALFVALTLWGTAIAIFGYPALIIVALAMVPIIFTCLFIITVGK